MVIDKRVLDIRKRAAKEIMTLISASGSNGVCSDSVALMVLDNHGLNKRFSEEYLGLLVSSGVVERIILNNKFVYRIKNKQ